MVVGVINKETGDFLHVSWKKEGREGWRELPHGILRECDSLLLGGTGVHRERSDLRQTSSDVNLPIEERSDLRQTSSDVNLPIEKGLTFVRQVAM